MTWDGNHTRQVVWLQTDETEVYRAPAPRNPTQNGANTYYIDGYVVEALHSCPAWKLPIRVLPLAGPAPFRTAG